MADASTRTITLIMIVVEALLALTGIILALVGGSRMNEPVGPALLTAGIIALIIAAALLPLGLFLQRVMRRLPPPEEIARAHDSLRAIEQTSAQLHQNSMLSDIAKRVLFREQELDLLRRAIEDDIQHGDYNAGLTLCDDMANVFGRREEAEALRTRILQAGHAAYEAKVKEAIDRLDQLLPTRDWAAVYREAASIKRLYPTHHMVIDLDARIMRFRESHKRDLERQFTDAAQRDDIAGAMALLKTLDRYLTREEASRLAPTAQAVVARHRDNLSMQFKLAVNDHRWSEAAQVGDVIMAEYPNTKMADEVRSMIEVLRTRAGQAVAAK